LIHNSNIVLGGGSWYNFNLVGLSKLLEAAKYLGIMGIDTAPSYGKSEYLLGKVANDVKGFKISTKVGKAGAFNLDSKIVRISIEKSLSLIKQDKIDCIYLHSVDFAFVQDSAILELINLKKIGVVDKIGVSCDGSAFNKFLELGVFDKFMITLNLVDQANYGNLLRAVDAGVDVIVKRSLANGVFSNTMHSRLRRLRRFYNKEIFGSEVVSYDFRNRILGKLNGKQLKFSDFAAYVFSLSSLYDLDVLIGTTSIKHLRRFRKSEIAFKYSEVEFQRFMNLFQLGNSYNWQAKI
jgi:aryl-alcohol dehydrogenase-like predicted oxidoreductase